MWALRHWLTEVPTEFSRTWKALLCEWWEKWIWSEWFVVCRCHFWRLWKKPWYCNVAWTLPEDLAAILTLWFLCLLKASYIFYMHSHHLSVLPPHQPKLWMNKKDCHELPSIVLPSHMPPAIPWTMSAVSAIKSDEEGGRGRLGSCVISRSSLGSQKTSASCFSCRQSGNKIPIPGGSVKMQP